MYKQFLPSLDLKRQQLLALRAKADQTLKKTKEEIKEIEETVSRKLVMLSNEKVDLIDLVSVKDVQIDEENLMGVRLPVLTSADILTRDYAFMGKPHWVDAVAANLKEMIYLHIRIQIEQKRLSLLNQAVQRITQRVNLFDKVLIPKARENIKRIQIYLSDAERASVVRAKIAKRKRAAEGLR